MGLEATEEIGYARGVLRDLGGERIDCARGVKELAVGAGNRSNGDESVSGAEKAAKRLAIDRVPEIGRVRSGDQLVV